MALAQARKARGGAPGDARLRRGERRASISERRGGLGTVAQGAGGHLAGGWRAPGRQPSDRGGRKSGSAGNAPAWAGGASAGPAPSEAVDDAIPRSMVVDGRDAEALLAVGEGKFCVRDLSPMP